MSHAGNPSRAEAVGRQACAERAATEDGERTLAETNGMLNASVIQGASPTLLPLARLLARQAARQHVLRHHGYGMIQIAICLGAAAALLAGGLILARNLGRLP